MITSQGRVCTLPFPVGVLSIYFAHISSQSSHLFHGTLSFGFHGGKNPESVKLCQNPRCKAGCFQATSMWKHHASLQTVPYKLEMNMLINMMKHEPLCKWTMNLCAHTSGQVLLKGPPYKVVFDDTFGRFWYTNICVWLFTDRNDYIQNNINYPSWNQQQKPLKTEGEVPKFDDPFLLGQAQLVLKGEVVVSGRVALPFNIQSRKAPPTNHV